MISAKFGEIITPVIKTSEFGGLPLEDLAEICTDKIIGVSETAPPAIREQAKFFRERVEKTIYDYLKRAAQSERANCIQICLKGGQENAADLLRRA